MKKLALLFALLPLTAFRPQAGQIGASAANATRYTVMMMGNKAGFQSASQNPDGSWQIHFEFNDRGRGPATDEHITLDKSGIPIATDNSGVDYYKAPVEEHFSLREGNATWKNRAEQGQRQGVGQAFYVSISGAPEESAILARVLLAAPQHKLPLLPAGEASIEKRGELKIDANGKSRTVVQYAITGLDFTPSPIWLDPDGKFFAVASAWSTVILEGWESTAEALIKAQDELDQKRAAELASTLGKKPGGGSGLSSRQCF
jgi:hypothetical protein